MLFCKKPTEYADYQGNFCKTPIFPLGFSGDVGMSFSVILLSVVVVLLAKMKSHNSFIWLWLYMDFHAFV